MYRCVKRPLPLVKHYCWLACWESAQQGEFNDAATAAAVVAATAAAVNTSVIK